MTPEQLAAIVESHGGQTGAIAIDPTTTDSEGMTQTNWTPQYKLTFADGTSMVVKPQATWTNDGGAANIVGWDVTDWGNAAGPKAPKGGVPDQLTTPSTNPYIVRQMADGSINQEPNPNYTPSRQDSPEDIALDRALKQAQIANYGRAGQGSDAEWARIALERQKANQPNISTSGRYVLKTDPWTGETSVTYELPPEQITPYQQATLDQNRTMNDADNQAAMMRQRLSTAGTVAGDIASSSQAARMWAMNPEWGGYTPGFEANGPYAQLLRMGGSSPQGIRLPEQQFDPTEAWRLATGAVGVR